IVLRYLSLTPPHTHARPHTHTHTHTVLATSPHEERVLNGKGTSALALIKTAWNHLPGVTQRQYKSVYANTNKRAHAHAHAHARRHTHTHTQRHKHAHVHMHTDTHT